MTAKMWKNSIIATVFRSLLNKGAIAERYTKETNRLKSFDFKQDYASIVFWGADFAGMFFILFGFTFDILVISSSVQKYFANNSYFSVSQMLKLSLIGGFVLALMIQVFLIGWGKRFFIDLFSKSWAYSRPRFFVVVFLGVFSMAALFASFSLSKGLPAAATAAREGQKSSYTAEQIERERYHDGIINAKKAEQKAEIDRTAGALVGKVNTLKAELANVEKTTANYQAKMDDWAKKKINFRGMPNGWMMYNYLRNSTKTISSLNEKILNAQTELNNATSGINERYAPIIAGLEAAKERDVANVIQKGQKVEASQDMLVGFIKWGNIVMNFLSFLLLAMKGFYLSNAMDVDMSTQFSDREYRWSPMWCAEKISGYMKAKGKDSMASRGGLKERLKKMWNGDDEKEQPIRRSATATPEDIDYEEGF